MTDSRLATRVFGIDFPNPIGLAAGFDKRGGAFNALGALGFGFVEIGTITAHGQAGNPKPRIFRIPRDQALLNRMGFNNPGADAVAGELRSSPLETILGINIGKSKVTPLEAAVEDYMQSLELLMPFASYLVVNVSSPNTPGLRELQDAEPLRELLRSVVAAARRADGSELPVLVKLAPDLSDAQLDQAVEIAVETGAAGIIAVNTTISRDGLQTPADQIDRLGNGGISGVPVRARAQEVVARIFASTGGRIPIVGVGGIFTAEDAWQRIRAGASLVQLYTGFIYEGPGIIKRIKQGLLERMENAGFESIGEVVGSGTR